MKDYFTALKGRQIPVINWNIFNSPEEATEAFNATNWEGWDSEWIPIATNGMGDAIVLSGGAVYEVEHGTGHPACLSEKLAEDPIQLASFLIQLSTFEECFKSDTPVTLRHKSDALSALKKEAPWPLKQYFNEAITSVKEALDDARWAQTAAGKLQAYVEANYRSWENDICEKWTVANLMIRRHSSNKAVGVIGVADQESINAIIDHVSQLSSYTVINLMKSPHD